MTAIRVSEVVGSKICVAAEDGHTLHNVIADRIQAKQDVQLSFAGVERLTTAFLNAAIGQLYGEFSEEQIRQHMQVIDATTAQLSLLKKVVDGAKRFFRDPKQYRANSGVDDEE